MKVECAYCKKIVDKDSSVSRRYLLGEFYFCSEKCVKDQDEKAKSDLWTIIAIVVALLLLAFILTVI